MSRNQEIAELQDILRLQKGLQDITNCINAAQNIRQMILEARLKISELFQVEATHIYVITGKEKKEIYTVIPAGDQPRERRTAVGNHTIPGYVANTGKMVRITDFSNNLQLNRYSDLMLETSADSRFGVPVRQILAMPVIYGGEILGAIEIINKRGGEDFKDEEPVLLQEIADVLGIALYNQQRMDPKIKKSKFSYLVTNDLITEADLNAAREDARVGKEPLEDVLMKKYSISKSDIGQSLEYFYQCKFFSFDPKMTIPGDLIKNLKKEYLTREVWVPLEKTDKGIRVLVDDPQNILKRDAIESLMKSKSIVYDVALKDDILKYIDFFFRSDAEQSTFTDLLGKLESVDGPQDADDGDEGIRESDSAIIQLVNKIINDAFARRASDIHIEPDVIDKNVLVRYRIDGECVLYQTLPYSYRSAIISRIKIMSNLDITIKRLPQDGKIKLKKPGVGEIELRVVTIPTQGGVEDVVMRILAKGDTLPLEAMQMTPRNYRELLKICEKPHGMILCVGPTGSGKTTTLHAILSHINKPDRKIWTAEDPVEITQRGLRQVQVHPKIGFDFATAMRAFLRADPDVIMVGEMRDFETAKIAVEASLTGHLVLSTLHTNSAPETNFPLLDMGIDPLNFADSLLGILAQRLVRTLCDKCKEAYTPTAEEFDQIVENYGRDHFAKQNIRYSKNLKLYRPKGCDSCDKTGYRGRIGVHELLINSEDIKKRTIERRESIDVIRSLAQSEGMLTLYQDGILKALQGVTDLKQVHRVCMSR